MRKLFVALIRGYQKLRPSWKKGNCRYYPTCSNYAIEACETYGTIGGILLAVWRIVRCNPFSERLDRDCHGSWQQYPNPFRRGQRPRMKDAVGNRQTHQKPN